MRAIVLCVVFVALAIVPALPLSSALAMDDGLAQERAEPRIARGRCSGPSRWRLVARRDRDSIQVTLVVRGGEPDQGWNVFMDHNGRGYFAGSRVSGPEGVFGVRRNAVNLRGVDRFRAAANNTVTGESCRGRVRT